MSKEEFITILDENLQGEIPQIEVDKNIKYYNNYYIEQTQIGIDDFEVSNRLGDPRLIAKTIIETYNMRSKITDDKYKNVYREESGKYNDEYGKIHTNTKYQIQSQLINRVKSVIKTVLIIFFIIFSIYFTIRLFLFIGFPIIIGILIYRLIRKSK